jgi:alpha-glucosidase (family GH31 glycosyl hydrolase)
MLMRASLLPYIYTAARVAYDTGLSLLTPMYYQWPSIDAAYKAATPKSAQYMFGPDIIVNPVVVPADKTT